MRKTLVAALFCVVLSSINTAAAADTDADGFKGGDWLVRGRVVGVIPAEDATLSIGGNVEIDDTVVPEIDVTYFFDSNWAAELIAATTPHDVTATAGNIDLGSVWLLPPTLTLQYHFNDMDGWKPYVGAGVNYTRFWNVDKGPAITSIKYDDSFGPALQAGFDVPMGDNWYFNADIKKIWINTDVRVNGTIRADVDINPTVVGIGVGYKF